MCGICGLIGPWGATAPDRALRMARRMAHRGPDEEGLWTGSGAALAHTRLAIVDVEGGHQPMTNEDATVAVVFNGEIYNHESLRRELEADGHVFRTRSDTEAIVHLYESDGLDFARKLDGMFAAAVWDARTRRFVLVRDRLGQKPLVYWRQGDRLAFASELPALREAGLPGGIDSSALDAYLTLGYIGAPATIYAAARKLPPASRLVFEGGRLTIDRYWSLDPERVERQTPGAIRERVASAVSKRLMADVPLGAFLSGGIDSSIVVACMARASAQPVRTFSIGFADRRYSELPKAAVVARRWGTEHREFVVEPDAVEAAELLASHFGEPYADSSAIPAYYVAREASAHVKTVLSGEGGDELFGGYERYAALKLAGRLGRWGLAGALSSQPVLGMLGVGGHPKSLRVAARRFLSSLPLSDAERYLSYVALTKTAQRRRLLNSVWRQRTAESDIEGEFRGRFDAAFRRDLVSRASWVDMTTYLPGDLLAKADICGMANSLEIRCPFLDYRLVEAALALPGADKCCHWQGKRILRQAFATDLPAEVKGGRKMGFAVPVSQWLRGSLAPWINGLLLGSEAQSGELLDRAEVAHLLREHKDRLRDHGAVLWALAMLELWLRAQ